MTVAAQAGGAEKLYWIVKRGERENPCRGPTGSTSRWMRAASQQDHHWQPMRFKAVCADRARRHRTFR